MKGQCEVCGAGPTVDRAHLKSRGAGAKWERHEWVKLCRKHHMDQHAYGWPRFLDQHPVFRITLAHQGWVLIDRGNGFRKLVRKEPDVNE